MTEPSSQKAGIDRQRDGIREEGGKINDLNSGHAALAALTRTPLRQIGRYVINEEQGRGGMGIVYRGWDPKLERPVAIKVLRATRSELPSSLERFQRESRAIAQLQHPGIVNVYATGIEDGTSWFVMELVDGASLEELLDEGLDDREVLKLLFEVAKALDYAHAHGVVHRDLKPGNVMVTGDGHARIVDFGVAHLDQETRLTRTGEILGTVLFMAPEQIQARPGSTGPAADMWSLGAMLYTALCGRPPFQGTSEIGVMASILRQEPEPPHSLRPDLPQGLDWLIRWCLQRDPDKRPTAAQATWLLSDLLCTWNLPKPRTTGQPLRRSRRRPRTASANVRITRGSLTAWLGAVAFTSYLFGFALGSWDDRPVDNLGTARPATRAESQGPPPRSKLALEPMKASPSQARAPGEPLQPR